MSIGSGSRHWDTIFLEKARESCECRLPTASAPTLHLEFVKFGAAMGEQDFLTRR